MAYGYFYDLHVTIYGESVLLALQSYVIVFLTVKYTNGWSLENGAWFVANGAFIAAIVTKSIPAHIISLLLVRIATSYCSFNPNKMASIYNFSSVEMFQVFCFGTEV